MIEVGVAKKPKKLLWLWIAIAVLAAVSAVGALWWWRSATVVAAPCSVKNITLSVGATDVAANVDYVHAVLTNKGDATCSMAGNPVTTILDSNGVRLGTSDAQFSDAYSPEKVILATGNQAHVLVAFPQEILFGQGVCSVQSTTLRMYLPGVEISPSTKALTAPLQKVVCPGITVSTVQPGV